MAPAPQIPASLRQIGEIAGPEAAVQLALACGGTRQLIPQKAEGSKLAGYVGIDAARAIVEALADERIEVPHARKVTFHYLRSQGWSQERCAQALKIARRTAQYWDKAVATPDRQQDLFAAR